MSGINDLVKGLVGNLVNLQEITDVLKKGQAVGQDFESRVAGTDIQDLVKLQHSLAAAKSKAQNRTYAMAAKGHQYRDYDADIAKVKARISELRQDIKDQPTMELKVQKSLEYNLPAKVILDQAVLPQLEVTLDATLDQIVSAAKLTKAQVAKLVREASEAPNATIEAFIDNYSSVLLAEFQTRLAKLTNGTPDHRVWTIVRKANLLLELSNKVVK